MTSANVSRLLYTMKGVTLIAIGKPEYGYWAVNMAVSIKVHNPDIKIQLIYEDKTVAKCLDRLGIFDYTTKIKHQHAYPAGFQPGFAKLNIYKYLKFKETIFLDVDGIVIKDLEPLFELCKGKPYATQIIGHGKLSQKSFGDNMYWASPKTLKDHYGFTDDQTLPFMNQSFAYVEKCDEAKELYNTALQHFKNPVPLDKLENIWGKTGQPDELYMNIALMQCGMDASIPNTPVYFCKKGWGAPMQLGKIKEKHYIVGYFGDGFSNNKHIVRLYDKLMSNHYKNFLNTNHIFKIHTMLNTKFVNG